MIFKPKTKLASLFLKTLTHYMPPLVNYNSTRGLALHNSVCGYPFDTTLPLQSREFNRLFIRTMLRQPIKHGLSILPNYSHTSLVPTRRTCTFLVSANRPAVEKDISNTSTPFSKVTPEQASASTAKEMEKNSTSPNQIQHNTVVYKDGDTYIDLGNISHSSKVANRTVVPFPQSVKKSLGKQFSNSNVVLSKNRGRMYKEHLLERLRLTKTGTAEEKDMLQSVKFTPPTKPLPPADENF